MTYHQFIKRILEDEQFLDADVRHYTRKHARRFFSTYKFCLKHLKKGDRILSIGAYYGSIEKLLKETLEMEITVVDFPDNVEAQKAYYDFLGFKYIGIDLSKGLDGIPEHYFNMIIYTEVIEHIPLSPYEQIKPFDKLLQNGGSIVISTPNQSSIVHIAKLFKGIPLFDTPEKFFSPIESENLHVHRREYMPAELVDTFKKLGYKSDHRFFIYNEPKNLQYRIMYFLGNIIPRFREGMLVAGIKP
jgi:2-polyprenyl-3-methyl-5-hydroxy-6-metoxy-1,4-benzoquinol methylase